MPHVNIWIRREDYEKWSNLEDRAEWLHDHLNDTKVPPKRVLQNEGKQNSAKEQKPDKDLIPVNDEKLKHLFEEKKTDHCPHGFNLKVSSCKYGCKK